MMEMITAPRNTTMRMPASVPSSPLPDAGEDGDTWWGARPPPLAPPPAAAAAVGMSQLSPSKPGLNEVKVGY